MEWVETTGRTVEDAKEAALDQLGVDESDAEFEVVEEARAGLFGRLRGEARVRARVRPTAPRAKDDRRDRRRRARANGEGRGRRIQHHWNGNRRRGERRDARNRSRRRPAARTGGDESDGRPRRGWRRRSKPARTTVDRQCPAARGPDRGTPSNPTATAARSAVEAGSDAPSANGLRAMPAGAALEVLRRGTRPGRNRVGRSHFGRQDSRPDRTTNASTNNGQEGANVEVALDEQGRIAQEFLTELVAEFGLQTPPSTSCDPMTTPSTSTCRAPTLAC